MQEVCKGNVAAVMEGLRSTEVAFWFRQAWHSWDFIPLPCTLLDFCGWPLITPCLCFAVPLHVGDNYWPSKQTVCKALLVGGLRCCGDWGCKSSFTVGSAWKTAKSVHLRYWAMSVNYLKDFCWQLQHALQPAVGQPYLVVVTHAGNRALCWPFHLEVKMGVTAMPWREERLRQLRIGF